MRKSKWSLLLLTAYFSAVSVVILSVSLTTGYWVSSEAKFDDESLQTRNSEVSYGLFSGQFNRFILNSETKYDLQLFCDYASNKCFYSCQQTSEKRRDEFERITNDVELAPCPESTSKARQFNEQVNATNNSAEMVANESKASAIYKTEMMSAGLWLATAIGMCLTITFASLYTLFAIYNIFYNPSIDILGVWGLHIWNGTAIGFCSLTMILWGSQYLIFIAGNIGISDTLKVVGHYSSRDLSSLGFSFWMLFGSIFCHLANIGLVLYRNYLLQKEPKPPAITVNKNDSTILVY